PRHARRRPHRTGGPAMTKTAEERAREILARAWLRRLFPSGYAASDEAKELRAMITEGFRHTEREVWRAAAEEAEAVAMAAEELEGEAPDELYASYVELARNVSRSFAKKLRRRAEEV